MTKHSLGFSWPLPIGLGLGLLCLAAPLSAQTRSLSWKESTRIEVPGALGIILRAVGVANSESPRQSIHLQGRVLIEENEQHASVMDLERRQWLTIDHQARSYSAVDFDRVAQLSRESFEALRAGSGADYTAVRDETRQALDEAGAEINVRFASRSTGQRRSFENGVGAVQHILSTEFEASAVPEGLDEPEGGAIVLVTELWQTTEVPSADALMTSWGEQLANDPAFRALAEEMAASATAMSEQMSMALGAWNPEVGAGLVRLGEAMEEIEGTTIESVTTVALVPRGVELNQEELLAWSPESMGDRLRGGAASAAREAARAAARSAVQGLSRGLLGGRRASDDTAAEPAADAPAVRPMMRLTTTKSDFSYQESGRDVAGELYARIADYREIPAEELFGQ